jgi:predicted double-glycine peptidase
MTMGLTGCAASVSGGAPAMSGTSSLADFRMPVTSVEDRRDTGIIRQRYDFSCGSAALATLLRYHYDYAVAEDAAFRGMWAKGDRAQIRRLGFSLLDMKRWLASHNLRADGYKVSLDDIEKTGVPGIVLISIKNYRHFVVVKGIRGDEVLLGDPSSGLTAMTRAQFAAIWNGVYFVISTDPADAKPHFNRTTNWAAVGRAPMGARFADPVSLQALSLTAPFRGDF